MSKIITTDSYSLANDKDDHERLHHKEKTKGARGVLEFIVRDKNGNIVQRWTEPNIVKIFAKEMLAHRLPATEVWDPNASGGIGAWVSSGIDPTDEFSARYILFGASFDTNGNPLDVDPRFYQRDPVTGVQVPIRLGPGAEFEGSLINAIPLTEPIRPLKRVENVIFQATFQPAGSPLIQTDVRGINNIVKFETTLQLNEYNGFGVTASDFFTITEVALAGGKKIDSVSNCDCTPRPLFLQNASDGSPLNCIANGSDIISIDPSETEIDMVRTGDQIKIVGQSDSVNVESIPQVSPFYLIISKAPGGRDIQLDRTPVDTNNVPISGQIGILRDTLRIFSHRVLATPLKKSSDFQITVIWSIIFS